MQKMKPRLIATLVLVGVVGTMAFLVTRFALIGGVSSDDFDTYIRDHAPSHIEGQQTSSASPLPLIVSIRFPKSDSRGGLGFPDRTDVYTFATTSGVFECHAHVRRDRVCLVTFEKSAPPSEFREGLVNKFPKLLIR